VRAGRVVKGVQFRDLQDAGDIVELAKRYCDEGADELMLYDITASPEGRPATRKWIEGVARLLDIPFCVAGGITSMEEAEQILNAGAEKISVNTPAVLSPGLIDVLAKRFGSQCVVVSIDSRTERSGHRVQTHSGDQARAHNTGRDVLQWVREVQDRGAGEIVLNHIASDGVRNGYAIDHLREVREICRVPLVASGGAGTVSHFAEVFSKAQVDGALAASVFHSGAIRIDILKHELRSNGIPVRITREAVR
jgi:imidazole glycerol-phosphate synthase subunit HisF